MDENEKTWWEHFEHEADVGVRGRGPSKERAFEQAAVALTAVITEPQKVEARQRIEVTCEADDDELLFADWLNCLLYEMDTRKMLFSRFEVQIENHKLKAAAWGQKTNIAKHCPAVEVKAATYTCLGVRQERDGTWIAQCVVDV
jgi:tRNA nucleotidyltransferase (CCA-adding enzyme)